jgi:hypothetical protein
LCAEPVEIVFDDSEIATNAKPSADIPLVQKFVRSFFMDELHNLHHIAQTQTIAASAQTTSQLCDAEDKISD